MRRPLANLAALAAAISLVSLARAEDPKKPEEPKVTRTAVGNGDVAKPALEALKKKYEKGKIIAGGATKVSTEQKGPDGKATTTVVYELKVKDGSRKVIVHMTAEGKITLEEEHVDYKTLPDAVKKTLSGNPKYQRFTASADRYTLKVTPEEKDEMSFYEIIIDASDTFMEIVVDKEGRMKRFKMEAHVEGGCHQRF